MEFIFAYHLFDLASGGMKVFYGHILATPHAMTDEFKINCALFIVGFD